MCTIKMWNPVSLDTSTFSRTLNDIEHISNIGALGTCKVGSYIFVQTTKLTFFGKICDIYIYILNIYSIELFQIVSDTEYNI